MVLILPGSALQGFIGVLIALGGLMSYTITRPFVEDASDNLAMATQLSTFFVFFSALMVQVDAVYHRSGFDVLLTAITFAPPFISLCASIHTFQRVMKEAPDTNSSKAAPSRHGRRVWLEKPVLLDTVRARDVIAGAWSRPRDFPGAINSFNNTHLTQRIASGSGAPGANAVSRSRLSASVTGHFSLAAVVWNQVMTVVKGQSQGCLAWVWNSLPLR